MLMRILMLPFREKNIFQRTEEQGRIALRFDLLERRAGTEFSGQTGGHVLPNFWTTPTLILHKHKNFPYKISSIIAKILSYFKLLQKFHTSVYYFNCLFSQ